MLTGVTFKNFKALEAVSLPLERLTVLIGANGTGKTSILEGIYAVCEVIRPRDGAEFGDEALARIFSGRMAYGLLSTAPSQRTAQVTVTGPAKASLQLTHGHNSVVALTTKEWNQTASLSNGSEVALIRHNTPADFPSATLVCSSISELTRASSFDSKRPILGADGSGLAALLAELLVTRSPLLDTIQAALKRIIPLAGNLRTPSVTLTREEREVISINGNSITTPVRRSYRGHRLELEIGNAGFVPAEALSEGTLLVLGLLTMLHTSPRPHVFLLDDIDRGLHPQAQRQVLEMLRRFVEENDDVQVVCTSHSPYALDHFKSDEVLVMKSDQGGRAHCRKLTEHPDWERWKDVMQTGEFWSSVGEDWVYGAEDNAG